VQIKLYRFLSKTHVFWTVLQSIRCINLRHTYTFPYRMGEVGKLIIDGSCQSNNDLNINRYFKKNIDQWLVILKMSDISCLSIWQKYIAIKSIDFKNRKNRLKYTKICKPRYRSIFFYLTNHRFRDLEIQQIPSPFFINGVWIFLMFFMLKWHYRFNIDLQT
jgi:hypothetical protein